VRRAATLVGMTGTDVLDQLFTTPARTDDDVVALVSGVVGRPLRRQCWVLFLDDRALPVPFLLPVSDLPLEPDDRVEDFATLVAEVCVDNSASEVVLVWERPGGTRLFPVDREWIEACDRAFADRAVRLRAQVVVLATRVRVVEPDEPEWADEPVDPVDPVEPVEPVDPVDPVDPVEPVGPVEYDETVAYDGYDGFGGDVVRVPA